MTNPAETADLPIGIETASEPANRKEAKKFDLWGWIRFILYMATAYFIVTHVVGIDRVSGHSMLPTLKDGQILLVNKLSTYTRSPHYGDVVIVDSHKLSYKLVKRVIGTEGDRVKVAGGSVYVNGQVLPELYTLGKSDDMPEVTVGDDEVFVLGDNRQPGESLDSRSTELGMVSKSEIRGYILMKLIPWGAIAKPLKE